MQDFTNSDEAAIKAARLSARYHLLCMWLERLHRPKTRTPAVDVLSVAHLFEATYPGAVGSIDQVVVALADTGFLLHLRRDGRLMTNVRDSSMFATMRGLRGADSPCHQDADGRWVVDYTPPDAQWGERLARIDAEIATLLEQRADHRHDHALN